MLRRSWIALLIAATLLSAPSYADELSKEIKKAIERSTLDQPGTKPFRLKAVLAPSFERDKDSGRTGEIEIWWVSPTQWRREVKSPDFRQIEILNAGQDWQKSDGDYFPEWLRRAGIELIRPVPPPLDEVLEKVKKEAEVRQIGPMTSVQWTSVSGTPEAPNILRSYIAVQKATGLLLYGGGPGWGAEFKDYKDFHGRMIAQTVNVGDIQVTAKVTTLEDLGETPGDFFDASQKDADPQPLQTEVIDEASLRKNLLHMDPVSWPTVQDGPLEGKVSTDVVIDRQGKLRDIGTIVSENPGMVEAGRSAFAAMRFRPFLVNGVAVQVVSQITIPFKTTRPVGGEALDSAQNYFEKGRHAGFPAAGIGSPYVLHATFETTGKAGTVDKGRYEDTWLSENQWRREAWFEGSRYVRSRNGEKSYLQAEGVEAPVARFVLKALEPIPAIDTFTESDWKIRRDHVDGAPTIRVLAGPETPEGNPENGRAYWFDDTGMLVKAYLGGMELRRSDFEEFAGVRIARRIEVLKGGKLAMRITITDVLAAGPVPTKMFEVRRHKWKRAFTDQVR